MLPGASLSVGDFTSACVDSATRRTSACVYDSKNFFAREVANGTTPAYIARSLNLYWDTNPTSYPSVAVAESVSAYAYVGSAVPTQLPAEIHQFGLLHMPWGATSTQVSSVQANWEFQTLMGLKQSLPSIARVDNWGGFASVANGGNPINLLEGTGYIRMILDNHQGAELYRLPVASQALPAGNELMAVALVEGNSYQIVLSNTDVVAVNSNLAQMRPDAPVQLSFTLPAAWPAAQGWSYLRNSQASVDNVFAQVKRDFANASPSILEAHFAACAVCFSDPLSMTTNVTAARAIVAANWSSGSNYLQTIQNSLKWHGVASRNAANQLNIDQNGVTHAFTQSGQTLNVTLGPNEMLVLRPY